MIRGVVNMRKFQEGDYVFDSHAGEFGVVQGYTDANLVVVDYSGCSTEEAIDHAPEDDLELV